MRTAFIVLAAGLLMSPASVLAQVAWDAPQLLPPEAPVGTGIYLVETAGGDLGLMVHGRQSASPHGMGWRLGLADDGRGSVAGYGGVDFNGIINRASVDFPLDVSWLAGGGAAVGDFFVISIPAGVSFGHTFVGSEGIRFTPYLSPRLILDATFGVETVDGRDADSVDLDFTVDIGFDLDFSRVWMLRFGAALGDREAVAVGVMF